MSATAADLALTYPLFSDAGLVLARKLGIAFHAPGKSPLPVPTVYLVDARGRILFYHVDPNFKQRLQNSVIIAAAEAFK